MSDKANRHYCLICQGKGRVKHTNTFKCMVCHGTGKKFNFGIPISGCPSCANCQGKGTITTTHEATCIRCGGRGYFGEHDPFWKVLIDNLETLPLFQ